MSVKTIYHLLGQISVTYATLEHWLVNLLGFLLTEDDCSLVRPYILDKMPLFQLIGKIRTVAELRLSEHKETLTELKAILTGIDKLRNARNIFIHGDWLTEDLTDNSESVIVHDYKPHLDKTTGVWTYLNSDRVSRKKLNNLLKQASKLVEQLSEIKEQIRKLKLR
jgi:hypothetical protein